MTNELHDFPAGYVGRKTYVTVHGMSGMLPKYKTYQGSDGKYHLHPDFGGDFSHLGADTSYIIPDKGAYHSPMDNTTVEGRTAHREHMRKHGVVEAGDLKLGQMTAAREQYNSMGSAHSDIRRAIQELQSR